MKSNFNISVNYVLKDEGGYTNDPDDNGGATKYGITITDVKRYVKENATSQDVRNLSIDEAKSIYKSKYWDALGCDDLTSGVDYTCFDYGVNSGLNRPRKALQRFNSLSGMSLINSINDERTSFLNSLADNNPKDRKFLSGWLNRVERVRERSKQLFNKNYTIGPIVGSGTILTGISISRYWHQHEWVIVSAALAGAVIVGILIHYLINKGK